MSVLFGLRTVVDSDSDSDSDDYFIAPPAPQVEQDVKTLKRIEQSLETRQHAFIKFQDQYGESFEFVQNSSELMDQHSPPFLRLYNEYSGAHADVFANRTVLINGNTFSNVQVVKM